jgi:hypothetical protein
METCLRTDRGTAEILAVGAEAARPRSPEHAARALALARRLSGDPPTPALP